MGRCLDKIAHKTDTCNTDRGLQVFEGDEGVVNGYCFSCETYVDNPYGEVRMAKDMPPPKLKKNPEEVDAQLAEIAECGTVDLVSRRLRGDSLAKFGVKVGLNTKDGKTPNIVFFPLRNDGKIIRYKARLLEQKKMWAVGHGGDVDLFGWEEAKKSGARRLIITEGEYDTVALDKIIEMHTTEQYKDYKPAVVSLQHGVKSASKDLARLAPKIRKYFQDISLCFDDDEPGQAAVKEAMKIFPHATSITLPSKDANACILEGTTKAAFKAVMFRAEKPKNSSLIDVEDLFEAAKVPAEMGVSWPWPVMTDLTRGIRTGETIYIAAGEKLGKSEVVNAVAGHLVTEHKWKVFLAKPEEATKKTVKMLANKLVGQVFTDPHIPFNEPAFDKACDIMRGNVKLLNVYQHISWETLRSDLCAAAAWGAKAAFIDPLTCLTNGMSGAERNDKLMEIGQELAALALDLDIVIFIFAHLNKPAAGATPWDRGGKITTNYFAGSSGMARSCNYAMGLEGNKDPELTDDERNMRKLVILADREFGESGECNLFWNRKNHMFSQV